MRTFSVFKIVIYEYFCQIHSTVEFNILIHFFIIIFMFKSFRTLLYDIKSSVIDTDWF